MLSRPTVLTHCPYLWLPAMMDYCTVQCVREQTVMGVSRGPPNTPTHTDTHIPAVRVVVCRVLKGAGLEIKVTEGRGQQGWSCALLLHKHTHTRRWNVRAWAGYITHQHIHSEVVFVRPGFCSAWAGCIPAVTIWTGTEVRTQRERRMG